VLSEPEQIVKGALAQRYNTFRGQRGLRLYMPPLPPHVIQELRTLTAPNASGHGSRSSSPIHLSASFASVLAQRGNSGASSVSRGNSGASSAQCVAPASTGHR
jgi:hypothetical protein